MKRTGLTILLAVLLILSASGSVPAGETADMKSPELIFSAEIEGGKLYRSGEIRVVELNGNYRQMGRQYGMLLKGDLKELYHDAIDKFFIKKKGFSLERLKTIARSIFDLYPRRYKEIIYGMAETSGLGAEKQILLNAIEWFPKINHLSFDHCSGVAAWGPYTSGGPLVFGRNNDDDSLYKDFARFMVVSVFNADDGTIPTALINYAGVIYNATGMNSDGLFVELNSGPWMGFCLDRTSMFVTLFSFLQDYASLSEIDNAFNATLPNLSTIVNVADKNRAYSYESSLYDTRRRNPERDGFMAATNHFMGSTWKLTQIDDSVLPTTSYKRYRNLLALGEKYRGKFNPQIMMKVLDTSIENGGPTDTKETIYQVIAVPAELKIWLKVPGFQDWTEVGLGPLFRKD